MKKITEQQLDSLTHELSSAIETQTDLTIDEHDLYVLNETLTTFAIDTLGAEVITEPEEFIPGNFLTLGAAGTHRNSYGVIAFPKDENQTLELHGPFQDEEFTRDYVFKLRKEYEDYQQFQVCEIYLPSIGGSIPGSTT